MAGVLMFSKVYGIIDKMEELALEIKRTWVYGLVIDCPMGKALDNCPAQSVRRLPLEERIAMVRQMEEIQLQEILMHHKRCFKEREKA